MHQADRDYLPWQCPNTAIDWKKAWRRRPYIIWNMPLFFHDETNFTALRSLSYDRPFRDRRHEPLFVAWQSLLRQQSPFSAYQKFASCAVVGSSGSLLVGKPKGELIDSYEAVFRVP